MDTLTLIQNRISTREMERISRVLDESPEGTQAGLSVSFASLLGALIGKANASIAGDTDIFTLLKDGQPRDGWPEDMQEILDGLASGKSQHHSHSLLTSLFGSKIGPVSELIATRCRIKPDSATWLLEIAAPFLMGTLDQQVSSAGVRAAGLGHLLRAQTPFVGKILPSRLADILGIGYLFGKPHPFPTAMLPVNPATAPWNKIQKWAWVPALMLVGWFAARQFGPSTEMGGTSDSDAGSTGSGQGYRTWDASNLDLRVDGFADELAKAVSSGGKNRFIDLPANTTEDGGALSESGKNSIRQLAVVMLANPNAKIYVIGRGQTAETGFALATEIKSNLVLSGVNDGRISINGEIGNQSPTLFIVPQSGETMTNSPPK